MLAGRTGRTGHLREVWRVVQLGIWIRISARGMRSEQCWKWMPGWSPICQNRSFNLWASEAAAGDGGSWRGIADLLAARSPSFCTSKVFLPQENSKASVPKIRVDKKNNDSLKQALLITDPSPLLSTRRPPPPPSAWTNPFWKASSAALLQMVTSTTTLATVMATTTSRDAIT